MCIITDENGNILSEKEQEEFLKEIEEKYSDQSERASCDLGDCFIIK